MSPEFYLKIEIQSLVFSDYHIGYVKHSDGWSALD